ncbi:MAG: tRNA dihydrouridine synthase DusB [Bacteroidales bacterium]|jgi:nifR3 family TIM-barrel protein|nr:tRNA dihydrouridine synthase DusB [Bacteroidales bacterium]
MQIGTIEFEKYPVFAAPMEDVSEPSFRYMCKKHGADLLYSEFAAADALVRSINQTMRKLIAFEYERPFAIQIFGNNAETMAEAAKIVAEVKPDIIDINFGCPVKKIAGKGSGAGLLRNIPKMISIAKSVVEAVDIPVTAKTRLGWDALDMPIVSVAEALQDAGIQALTIHGRTRAQMYTGEADWRLIGEVKNNPRMHIPIIGNGDIDSPQKAKAAFDTYGVDAIMIGRASIGAPWIFRDVKHFLHTGELLPQLSIKEQVAELKDYTLKSVEFKGLPGGVIHMRRQFAKAFKGFENFRETRIALLTKSELHETLQLLDEIAEKWG